MNEAATATRPKKGSAEDLAARMLDRRKAVEPVPSILDKPETPSGEAPVLRRKILVDSIRRSRYQRRTKIDPEHVANLAASIKAEGLHADIYVREMDDGMYELIAGENRWEAHKLLGLAEIDAKIRRMSNEEAAKALTSDNLQQKTLTDWETFLHFQMLEEEGFVNTDEELAELSGKKRPYVTKIQAFAALPPEAQEVLNEHPAAIGAELALKLRATGLTEDEPELVSAALREVAEKGMLQKGVLPWIQGKQKERQGAEKTGKLIRDNQFVHNRRKVRVLVKEDSFQITVRGLKGEDIEKLVMERLDEFVPVKAT